MRRIAVLVALVCAGPLVWAGPTLSWASTATPAAWPMIQLFGSGFGQAGSTRKAGASSPSSARGLSSGRVRSPARPTPRSRRPSGSIRPFLPVRLLPVL
jgi:hypothetical protein